MSLSLFLQLLLIQFVFGDPQEGQFLQGGLKINGQRYQTVCSCTGGVYEEHPALVNCDPSKIKLVQDRDGEGGSFDDVRNIIGNPSELSFVNVAEAHFSCMDGRLDEKVLGVPGGDAGEFILALHVYEGMTERILTAESIEALFTRYLKSMKPDKFYMCTDDSALTHLEKESGITVNIEILRNPQPANQNDLIEMLIRPDNMGSLHLKKLLRNPYFYSIRPELVTTFLRVFYKILWDRGNNVREKLFLESFVGVHDEYAFVEVRSNEACMTAQVAPLINQRGKNSKKGPSIFINHLDAVSIRRAQFARFFSDQSKEKHIDPITMHHLLNKQGKAFLEVTGLTVAKKLPFYTLNLV